MRGVNLEVFDLDYDTTWAALFLGADETVHGRFGGREPASAGKYLSLAGLRYALGEALVRHHSAPAGPVRLRKAAQTPEQYPAAKQLAPRSCIHCHNVYDFRRQ